MSLALPNQGCHGPEIPEIPENPEIVLKFYSKSWKNSMLSWNPEIVLKLGIKVKILEYFRILPRI